MYKKSNVEKRYSESDSLVNSYLFGVEPSVEEERQEYRKSKNFFNVFIVIIVLIAICILVMPILPATEVPEIEDVAYEEAVVEESLAQTVFEENRLIIPAIGVNVEIVEGANESALSLGAWRRPNSSTPDIEGNTVITGHRFHYIPPNNKTFYNLDKLDIGRKIFVHWEGNQYTYLVKESFVVEDTRIDIESDSPGRVLTLYTCHPLWTADKRLVIRGELVESL